MEKDISIQVRDSAENRDRYKAAADALDTSLADIARKAWESAVKKADKRKNPTGQDNG